MTLTIPHLGGSKSESSSAIGTVIGVLGAVVAIAVVLVVAFLLWRKNPFTCTNSNSGFENPTCRGDEYK